MDYLKNLTESQVSHLYEVDPTSGLTNGKPPKRRSAWCRISFDRAL